MAEYALLEQEAEDKTPDEQDKLLNVMNESAAHGQHKNLSFIAFTATPKDKTLQMFGQREADGKYRAFHVYSMRQAIEEGFIFDIQKNYMTNAMYYKIIKSIANDPLIDSTQGARAVCKYESLHPHNIAQKTAVIIDHFRNIIIISHGVYLGTTTQKLLLCPSFQPLSGAVQRIILKAYALPMDAYPVPCVCHACSGIYA